MDITSLKNLLESTVNRRAQALALVELNGGDGPLADALRGELELLVHLLVRRKHRSG